MKPVYIVDVFKEIVSKVSTNLTTELSAIDTNITGVHYDYGHPIEVIQTLAQKDKSNKFMFDKYPLVALFQDFNESYTTDKRVASAPDEVNLHLIIAKATKQDYKASERYEENFKPFLYPIYNELMRQIFLSGKFLVYDKNLISHTKIDRMFWGKEGLYKNSGNVFNDMIDVIEIKNLKLKTHLKIC